MALKSERSTMNEGMLWSVWAEKSGLKLLDSDDEPEENIKRETDAMHLKKEDMHLFGQCPTWDEFYLVVCNFCNSVVKPQAFKHHIELRHANSSLPQNENSQTKPLVNKSKGSSTTMPLVAGKSSNKSNATTTHRSSNNSKSNGSPTGGPTSKHKSSGKKNNHVVTPVVRVERMPENMVMVSASASHGNGALNMERKLPTPQQPPPPPPLTDTPSLSSLVNCMTSNNVAKLLLNSSPGPPSSPACTVKSSSPSSSTSSTTSSIQPPVKKSSSSRSRKVPKEKKLVLCKDREYDPNKHCGVMSTDMGKPCTRSLTCKSHNLSSRRNVVGREKHFDQLLAEHKASKEPPTPSSPLTSLPSPSCSKNSIPQVPTTSRASSSMVSQSSSTKSAITPSSPTSSIPNDRLTTTLKEEAPSLPSPSTERVPKCPSPIVYKVEAGDPPYITHFPRPAAVCAFGMRQLSSGLYLLDRRFDFQAARLQQYQFTRPTPVLNSLSNTSSSVNKKPIQEVLNSSKSQLVKKEEESTKVSLSESPDKTSNPPPSKKKKLVPNGTACSGPNSMPTATTMLPLKFPLSIRENMGALSRFQLPPRKELVNGHLVHSLTVNKGYCVQPLMTDSSSPFIRTENNSPLMPAVSSPSLINGIGPYHKSNSHSHDIGPFKGKGTSRNSTVQKISAVGSVLTSPAFTLTTAPNNNYPHHHPVLTNHSAGYKLLAPNQDSRTLNQGSYLPS